jgi:acetyl-CoA carboxylase carboxyl transferase alpha subunit
MSRTELFEEVCSQDFLKFKFGGRGYQDQLYDSIAKTKRLAGVRSELIEVPVNGENVKVVWVQHDFGFLGGSLGCAEGEKITRSFEYAIENKLPVCVQCRSGGARMQEGTSSLMQMAKVSVAVEALHRAKLPFVAVLSDPTYGGVSASYAMQADIKIALSDARIGFAGPAVILNTMCEADQSKFDTQCPPDFQSAQYLHQHGQVDAVLDITGKTKVEAQDNVELEVAGIMRLLMNPNQGKINSNDNDNESETAATEADMNAPFNYTNSRRIDRPQTQDVIASLFTSFFELSGDGRVGRDICMRGGLASFGGRACVVLGTYKGHSPKTMEEANYGMSSPHGYRMALRLMKMAERFGLFVVTLVDTVGAWPTFECEGDGQSEAIATNLTIMAGLEVPIITIMVGEGGSGGALGIGMGNTVGMLSGGYFGVISPEGAASILGRYKDDAHKAEQFPKDCQELATAQCIYAYQLKEIGVVDEILWESADGESHNNFPILSSRIRAFIVRSLEDLENKSGIELVQHRYKKFRALGTFSELDENQRADAVADAVSRSNRPAREAKKPSVPSALIKHLAEECVTGVNSRHRGLAPKSCPTMPPVPTKYTVDPKPAGWTNAKHILDAEGPEAMSKWVKSRSQVLVTDTTMRDAHQSLFATRARSEDLILGATIANDLLRDAFSLECWGGATFDVCMRFLDECPWERLRAIRAACPDVCLQMLIRGANAVGYTSYPDNVVTEFVRLSAENGMDVFRIFDCFNVLDNMQVAIDAVRANNKVAEVCLCYTGDLLTSNIYDVEYYRNLAKVVTEAGAHIIGIKDMAGLMRPLECKPLLEAIRSVSDLPIHFHTHSTSSGTLTTAMEMARLGCDVVDFATASMADGTSQPSLNAFVAMMDGASNGTGMDFLKLEPYDMYWARVRDMYSPFESGMKSGSARVFEHQIPGGQYSNLLVQCQSMGLWDRWEEVLDAYRDVNQLFGDIVKVTPSSKCVGDLALYLVTRKLKAEDLYDPVKASQVDFPESVVGLLKGDLGFPHRGFPKQVEDIILKGAAKRTIRAGLQLTPADFEANRKALSEKWNQEITPEMGMSSIMYPGVFKDFMTRRANKGLLLRYLPTPVYFYAMEAGQQFTMNVPSNLVGEMSGDVVTSTGNETSAPTTAVNIVLRRVGPLREGKRQVVFGVDGKDQSFDIKDSTGVFVFDGPMADTKNTSHVASPMPGNILEILVKPGQVVKAGDTLMIISAMKMEVKSTAPFDGKVGKIVVETAARVVEGCLLCNIDA